MFDVHVTGLTEALANMDGVTARAKVVRPLLDDAADKVEQIAAAAFTDEGPGWAPLRPATQRDRASKGFLPAHPILVRTGTLRASATAKGGGGGRNHIRRYAGARAVEVGTSLAYARFQQQGTRRMPARPFYRFTPADRVVFRGAAVDYILGRWATPAAGQQRATGAA